MPFSCSQGAWAGQLVAPPAWMQGSFLNENSPFNLESGPLSLSLRALPRRPWRQRRQRPFNDRGEELRRLPCLLRGRAGWGSAAGRDRKGIPGRRRPIDRLGVLLRRWRPSSGGLFEEGGCQPPPDPKPQHLPPLVQPISWPNQHVRLPRHEGLLAARPRVRGLSRAARRS